MTNLTQIKNELANFAVKKVSLLENYLAKQDELADKVKSGAMYQSEADARLADYRKETDEYSSSTTEKIRQELEKQYDIELSLMKDSEEGVTADDVAELTLLSTMDMTVQEMKEYTQKYKNKPLAMKKLNQIAMQKPELIMSFDSVNLQGELHNLIQKFKRDLYYFDALRAGISQLEVQTQKMVANSVESTLTAILNSYVEKLK